MTIKIKAPVIWLDADWERSGYAVRCSLTEEKYRAVSDADWRKLMKLVKVVERCNYPEMPWDDVQNALKALSKEKKK